MIMFYKRGIVFLVFLLIFISSTNADLFFPESPPQGPPFINGNNQWAGINNFTGPVFISNLTVSTTNSTVVAGAINASEFCITDNGCVVNWTTDAGLWIEDSGFIRPYDFNTDVRVNSINASYGYFTELNVSNSSIHIGGVKLSGGVDELFISEGEGNVTAKYYYGSGQFLTDINLSSVNGTAVFNDNVFIASNLSVAGYVNTTEFCFGIDCIDDWDRWVNKTGDTMTGNLMFSNTAGITNIDFISFNITPMNALHGEGILHWNDDDKTLEVGTDVSGVQLQVGQEMYVRITNKLGYDINNSQVVYINGVIGQRPTIDLAISSSNNRSRVIGVATSNISNNHNGYITTFGIVRDMDTSSWAAGDVLYLSETIPGALTNIAPQAPSYPIQVATVLNSNSESGSILVNVGPTDVTNHMVINQLSINNNLTVNGTFTGGYLRYYNDGVYNGSLYTYGANGSLSLSNSLFQVLGDEGSPRLQVQNGGIEQAGLLVRSWIVVNQNNTRLQQAQNNLCGDWGFIHIDCNTSTTGADMGVQDDFEVQGIAFFDNGLRAHAQTHNPFIVTTDRGFKYSGVNGSYDTVDSFFCDYVSNNFVDTGGWVVINDEGHPYDGATADIDVWVNSSCVQLSNNPSWDDNFTNVMWKVKQSPEFINNYGGFFEFYVGDNIKSQFKIRTKNGTGDSSFLIESDAGVAQHTALNVQYDMNGFEGINGLHIDMGSSEVFANKTATMMLMEGDGTHMIDSRGVFIDMEVVGSPVNSEIIGINVNPNVNKIIESSAPDTIRSAYYNDVNVTANVTNVGDDLTVFINDNDYLYIGANLNFTTIGVTLSTDSSQNLNFNYYYCNNTGGYTQFVMSDSTNGFKTGGTLSFNNPANRGKCNTQINGTPFTDEKNYTYVVLQRTLNNVVTFPVIDLMTVSGGGTSFILQKNMLKLNPESAPPEMCNANFVGGIYVDTELNRPCYCDGTNWLSMADFTTICS